MHSELHVEHLVGVGAGVVHAEQRERTFISGRIELPLALASLVMSKREAAGALKSAVLNRLAHAVATKDATREVIADSGLLRRRCPLRTTDT